MLSLAVFYFVFLGTEYLFDNRMALYTDPSGAGDRRQPYLSPVRCSSGMFSALNEKTGTRSRIGLIQFYYNWEEDKKYLLVEIYLAKQK